MKSKKTQLKPKQMVIAALFGAMIFVATAYLPRIPVGAGGYLHIGDVFIYLAACLLPLPYAMVAAALGGTLADLLTGFPVWAPYTFVIKMLITVAFTNRNAKMLTPRNYIACVIAMPITTFGYYLAEAIIYNNFLSALASLPLNLAQAVVSAVIFIIIAAALDRSKMKERLQI